MSGIPKKFWALLVVSAALNLFFLGLFAARHDSFRGHGRPQAEDAGPRAFLRHSGLRDAGPEVQAILKQQRQQVRESARAMSTAREHVKQALTAQQFDRAQVDAAFAEVRAGMATMQTDMHRMLTEVASKLNVEQRTRMADELWRGHHPRP